MVDDIGDVIWGLEDYAIYVPMTDDFYKTLKFRRITKAQFDKGGYAHQPRYKDSRTYLEPILRHLSQDGIQPDVLDVGGYIGRFSIEAALVCRKLNLENRIICFEPGDTGEMLEKNLTLNGLADSVQLVRLAVSKSSAEIRFAINSRAMISSRIVLDKTKLLPGWSDRRVHSTRLQDYLQVDDNGRANPFICKIDTEGHEPEVMAGITRQTVQLTPHVFVIEFWPQVRETMLHGQSFEAYVFDRYRVFDIRSSLYPRTPEELSDFDGVSEEISSKKQTNLDLLMLSKNLPQLSSLVDEVRSGFGA